VVLLALGAAMVAVVLSVILPLTLSDRHLRTAFRALEDDFENLSRTVRSDLGRAYRYRRDKLRGEVPTQEGTETAGGGDNANGDGASPTFTPRQLEIQRRILARRRFT